MFPPPPSLIKVANILLNGVRYESDLGENVEAAESQMSMKLLCIAIYKMPPSLRSLCTNHFLGEADSPAARSFSHGAALL